MTLNNTSTNTINLTADDRVHNEQGNMSDDQRRKLHQLHYLWIAVTLGSICLFFALCIIVIYKLQEPSFASQGELWFGVPVILVWLWLLRSSFAHWRHIRHDLVAGHIAVIQGLARCEFSQGIGLIRIPRYHILVGEQRFRVDKHMFFQFKNQEYYRVFYTPAALVLLGAVQHVDVQSTASEQFSAANPVLSATAQATGTSNVVPPPQPQSLHTISSTTIVELVEPLTEHERAIVQLIAEGLSNKEIAVELSLSINTIKMYTSHMYRKLGVRRRTEAVARARQLNIL